MFVSGPLSLHYSTLLERLIGSCMYLPFAKITKVDKVALQLGGPWWMVAILLCRGSWLLYVNLSSHDVDSGTQFGSIYTRLLMNECGRRVLHKHFPLFVPFLYDTKHAIRAIFTHVTSDREEKENLVCDLLWSWSTSCFKVSVMRHSTKRT